jgi:RNA polymerase sigma factor (sigma-70 family)
MIVRDHGPMAYDTAWRILGNACDTQDAVQEAFVDAVRIARGERIANWGGLLRRLVARRAIDLLRSRRGGRSLSMEPAAPLRMHPEAIAVGQELAERLRIALTQLPQRESEVFVLRYFADLSNIEIAESLKLSAGAVGVALHKARMRLAELLETAEE